ncbi:MAG TPA: nicotinate (nicotinamide) nucleotide adenylyltransferase [bacterium]|nr:nicotinate (nicotinamide) nucleotide adenylyltransferase [bacterium]
MKPPRSLGLFGGSFNPVHSGHLVLAREARKTLRLDEVWFIPCARSADRKALAPGALRLGWLKKALRGQEGLKACDLELKRGGISRTIDTLRELRECLGPQVEFTLLLGQDQALRLPQWKEADALPTLCRLAVFRRPGVAGAVPKGFKFQEVKAPILGISSSEIRAAIKKNRDISLWLPGALPKDTSLLACFGNTRKQ